MGVVLIKEATINQVEAIAQGKGKMLPKDVLERYGRLWFEDPTQANAQLLNFELLWNDVPFPEGTDEEVLKKLVCLLTIRFGLADENSLDWGIGIYGYPSPLRECVVN